MQTNAIEVERIKIFVVFESLFAFVCQTNVNGT